MSMKVTRVVVEGEKLDEGDVSRPMEETKLKKMARLYEYSCSFCFKRFYSAQAMGGHQNAHRLERIRHKKLFIKDPIGYRKTLKNNVTAMLTTKHRPLNNRHATRKSIMVKHQNTQKKQLTVERSSRAVRIKPKPAVSVDVIASYSNDCYCHNHPTFYPVQLHFLPPKELSLAEKVGNHAADEDAQFMACNEVEEENLDLTLKL